VFDAVFALHSIHHVPGLPAELERLKGWMKEGAPIAVDEHLQTDTTFGAMAREMESWFRDEVAPRHTTLALDEIAPPSSEGHSRLEGAGSEDVLASLVANFRIESLDFRFVSLDLFSFAYYLSRGLDVKAYDYAGDVIHRLYGFMQSAYPERVEYVSVVGQKALPLGPASPEIARLLARAVPAGSEALTALRESLPPERYAEVERIYAEWRAATTTVADLSASADVQKDAIDELRATVDGLNAAVHAKNQHIAGLEAELERRAAEIERKQSALDDHVRRLRRIEEGRLMRLLNRLTARGRKEPPTAKR
jgi:hypothetical protein